MIIEETLLFYVDQFEYRLQLRPRSTLQRNVQVSYLALDEVCLFTITPKDDDARAALAALRAAEEVAAEAERAAAAAAAAEEAQAEANNNTLLAAGNASSIVGGSRLPVGISRNTGSGAGAKKKIAGKPKMTAKERKERSVRSSLLWKQVCR